MNPYLPAPPPEPTPTAPAFDGSQPCKGHADLFFPTTGGNQKANAAKRICWGCPFRLPCLEYALTATSAYGRPVEGIWGGTSAEQRSWLRDNPGGVIEPPPPTVQGPPVAPGPKAQPIRHGTNGGYEAHRRRNDPVPVDDACGCRAAHNRHNADVARRRAAVLRDDPGDRPTVNDLGILRYPEPSPGGRPRSPIPHGTEAGYKAHRRHGVPIPPGDPCGCRAGHSAYVNGYSTTRRRRLRAERDGGAA